MGSQKLKVRFGLQTAFSLSGISHHMGEDIAIRVHAGLIPLCVHIGSRQHLSVRRQNLSPDYLIRETVLTRVVRTVDKIFTSKCREIDQISDQGYENRHKEIGDNCKFPVLGVPSLLLTLDILGFAERVRLSRLEISLPALVVFVFFPQFPHLHLPSIYKVPG